MAAARDADRAVGASTLAGPQNRKSLPGRAGEERQIDAFDADEPQLPLVQALQGLRQGAGSGPSHGRQAGDHRPVGEEACGVGHVPVQPLEPGGEGRFRRQHQGHDAAAPDGDAGKRRRLDNHDVG